MIRQDFSLELDDATIARVLGRGATRVLKSEKTRHAVEQARAELLDLARPAGAWRAVAVAGFEHDRIVLGNGTRIGGGPVVEVTCGATEIAVGISTIGPLVEERAKQCMDEGDSFHGFVLDAMASWAAGEVRLQLVAAVKDHYAARGFHTSIALGPGESDWPVDDQRAIFALVDGETTAIGVRLEPSLLMVPLKSTTFLIGAGPGPLGDEAGDPCTYCSLQGTCQHRGDHAR